MDKSPAAKAISAAESRPPATPVVLSVSKKFFDTLSNETHFVGLSFEKAAARRSALAYARTFASREAKML